MSAPLASPRHTSASGPPPAALLHRVVTLALLAALTVLFVEVLFEAWVQELLGDRTVDENGLLVGYIPNWPKVLKNGLIIGLVLLSAVKISLERRWREFLPSWRARGSNPPRRADLAIVVLALVMVAAGLLGTSGPSLIGEAVFVYLRGAVVFYAIRALQPSWPQIRRVLLVVVPIIGLNVLVAAVQMVVGRPAYSGIGWVDMAWADTNRAMGLLDHPNQLGHVLGLVIIGLVAWMSRPRSRPDADPAGASDEAAKPRPIGRSWWVALTVAALGLAGTQSRESLLGVLAAIALIWFLRRGGVGGPGQSGANGPGRGTGRTLLISAAVIVALFGGYLVARPGNFGEFAARVAGIFTAVETPPGTEDCDEFETNRECVEAGRVEKREIRMLFYQQGARLLAERPILGYGVGQFGGIVAEKHDPNWELDPRFPGGFNLYDFDGTTVDSFWLHLVVETGVLGLLAYLAWLWFLTVPLLAVTRRFGGRRVWGAGLARAPAGGRAEAAALWGVGTVIFSVIIGFFAPALEDALYPPLAFAVLGVAWVLAGASRPEPSDGTTRPPTPASTGL